MSQDVAPATLPGLDASFVPSLDLREGLGVAAVCALAAGAMRAAGALLAVAEGIPSGFTWSAGLELTAILPELFVALAFRHIGEETNDSRLKAVPLAMFLCLWGLQVYGVALDVYGVTLDENLPRWAPWVLYILAGLLAVLALAALSDLSPGAGKRLGYVLPAFLLLYFAARVAARFWLSDSVGLPQAGGVPIGVVLLLGVLVLPLWFSIVLVRREDRLGRLATILGLAQLLGYVGSVPLLFLLVAAPTGVLQELQGWDDETANQVLESLHTLINWAVAGTVVVWAALLAAFFVSVRGRRPTPRPMPTAATEPRP